MQPVSGEGESDVSEEQKLINEEYKVWKKNAVFLYDTLVTHALEWPSLTVQWLPDKQLPQDKDYSVQRLLMGTHTSGKEPNHAMLAHVRLPRDDMEPVLGSAVVGRDGELGGFSSSVAGGGRIEVVHKINHEGEVNRARYMWQNPNVFATKTPSAEILVFDRTKHPSKPPRDGACKPDVVLRGHEKEGFGLAWAPHKPGFLLSGSNDWLVCLWDVNAPGSEQLDPTAVFRAHQSVVEDVCWHGTDANLFGSVGDDKMLFLWDSRHSDTPTHKLQAHDDEVNAVSFNPFNEFLVATGSSDQFVKLWDIRNLSRSLYELWGHGDKVIAVEWSPFCDAVLASAACDRRVIVWNLAGIGREQTMEEAEDGDPALMFMHGGHTDKVSDIAWNPNEDWILASVSENNILQIWKVSWSYTCSDTYR